MKVLLCFVVLFCVAAIAVPAADITGTWKGSADTPVGTVERTFVFKADGNKLTGETTSQMTGKSQIDDGKIDGDHISFTITANVQGNDMKFNYTGVVKADSIDLTAELPSMGYKVSYTVKRVADKS